MEFTAQRIIHTADALVWLEAQPVLTGCSLVTSLPDYSEFGALSVAEWKTWFTDAAALVLSRCPPEGVTLFFQSDIRVNGEWIDKGYLCQKAAERLGHALVWHKMVCRVPPGNPSYNRAGYSHLLCFSQTIRPEIARSTPDVLPRPGEVTWARGMGVEACLVACRFIMEHTVTRTVVDPFCGQGGLLAIANELGLDAVGVEKSPKQSRKARRLKSTEFRLHWDIEER